MLEMERWRVAREWWEWSGVGDSGGRGNTISDDAYGNTGVLAWQLRGPLFFTRGPWWTVNQGSVDRVNLRVDRGGP